MVARDCGSFRTRKTQEGPDRRQSGVPAANGVFPDFLEMIQERQYQRSIEIGQDQTVCRLVLVLSGKLEQ